MEQDKSNQNTQRTVEQNKVQPQVVQPILASSSKPFNNADKIKRFFFQVLIGCLLAFAGIAVAAVLIGGFTEVLGRSIGTIAMVAIHSLLSFSYISETEKRGKNEGYQTIDFFSNFVFGLIAASFITSIFAMWEILGGDITFRLYMLYGVLLFATLHSDALYRIRRFDSKIDLLVTANYLVMAVVVALLCMVIFAPTASDLGELFYRILAAIGIIDATMTITAIIMHKMFLQKHPELIETSKNSEAPKKNIWHNPFIIIIIIFLLLQALGLIIGALI